MSYEVIARKYRPQKFDDLIGQKPISETLKNAIEMGKVSHAYLFSGPRGVGKTSAARILAKSLNCLQKTSHDPCGKCQNCEDISRGGSLDVIEIDGASNRGIDEIRELKEKVNYSPIHSQYKVYIIDEVHMLTTPAFNALLKTLEEPPRHIIFIFATTEAHLIPLTVLSRCQRFDFRRITTLEISGQLGKICEKEGVKAEKNALFLLAKSSDGSMRDAQSALDQLIAFSGNEITVDKVGKMFGLPLTEVYRHYVKFIMEKDVRKGMELINQLYQQGVDLRLFLEGLIDFLRDLFLVKNGIEDEEILDENKEEIGNLKVLAQDMDLAVLDEMIKYLITFLQNFKYTAQFKILVETSFLNLTDISQKISLKFIYDFIKGFEETAERGVLAVNKAAFLESAPVEDSPKPPLPSSPGPSGDSPDPDKDKNDLWNVFVNKVGEKGKVLASSLRTGVLKAIQDNEITIQLNKKLYFGHLNSPPVMDILKKIGKELFNKDYNFKFELNETQEQEEKGKAEDPVIDKAKAIFRGTIKK
ncbi:MAG: DNA polymerase III subunit gamma/tau [bacterium]|nr:DNA polymerase III subunit gamma/tau [bacterium]